MTTTDQPDDLAGKCVIAMPDMPDPRFKSSVIFLCAHSREGAMGLIINKKSDDVQLGDLMDQLSIPKNEAAQTFPVYFGGPVEHGRGFVLHTPEYYSDLSTMKVNADFSMTATIDILEDIGGGKGPNKALVALGYAGWGPGQLEAEIAANGWLLSDASADIVFAEKDAAKWSAALATIGIDPAILSSSGGRA